MIHAFESLRQPTVQAWLTTELMQRLAGSLLHFVWQGALLAMLTAIVLRMLSTHSPRLRYTVSVVALFLMLAAPIFTFMFYSETGRITLRILRWIGDSMQDGGRFPAHAATVAAWTQWIVLFWFAGVFVCSLRLIAGWRMSISLIRFGTSSASSHLKTIFHDIKARLEMIRPVRLLVSVCIDTPVAVGWLRPAILLPAAALTGLNEIQMRAVLAHELAHIRRHDFLVNLAQRVVESVLFYHPAVWWISARVRAERELCCDDLAVQVSGDPSMYAEALMELERVRTMNLEPAVAATGGILTRRIRRLLGYRIVNSDLQSAIAAMSFVVVWIVAGAWQSNGTLQAKSTTLPAPSQVVANAERISAAVAKNALNAEALAPRPAPERTVVNSGNTPAGVAGAMDAIAAILTAQPLEPIQASPPVTSNIDGVVKHSGTTDLVSNVVVSLIPQSGRPLTSTTDEKGRFLFKNVASGAFRLQTQRDGYIPAPKGAGPQTLTVTAGQDIHDVELKLVQSGTIRGRIEDNAGQPLKGMQVSAVMVSYNNGREAPIQVVNRVVTDDHGEYRVSGLTSGDYFIKAETPNATGATAPPKMVSYYPGTLNAPEAAPVRLAEGLESEGINFKLQAPDSRLLHRISGTVTIPMETAGSGIVGNLYLFPKDRPAGADGNGYTILSTNRADGKSNGTFVLNDVPSGRYDLIAALPGLSVQREYSRTEILVGDKDLDGVIMPLSRKFEVRGKVTLDGAEASIPRESLRVVLTTDSQLGNASSPVDSTGAFDFKDIAEGKYSISVAAGLPAGAYVADIRQNSKSIFAGITSPDDALIDVNSQSSAGSPIEVIVNPRGAAVTVTVQDAKSMPVPEATVALIPDAPRRQTLMWFKTGVSDDRGRVTLNGVAPGNYKIFAWERTPLRAYQSEDFLSEYETKGKSIHVDSDGRPDATVTVIPDDAKAPPRTFKTGAHFSPAPPDRISSAPSAIPANPNNAIVEGKVTRLKTGEPIPGIPVYVGGKSTLSGPDGHYIINDVPPGTYSLDMSNAQKLGFYPSSHGGFPGNITVSAKQHIDDLNFKLTAGGTISGRVFDSNGQPVKNALMQLEKPDYQYSKHYLLSALIVSRTGDQGDYRISGIEPGEYYLRVRAAVGGLATTYFPNTIDIAKARVVTVHEDDEIPGMDINAQPLTGYAISGTAVPPVRGDNPPSTSFYLIPADNSIRDMLDMLVQPMRDPSTGSFVIANVTPGSYDLLVLTTVGRGTGPFGIPDAAYMAETRVDVRNQDVSGVTMTFSAAVDVRGRIVVDGDSNAVPLDTVHLYPSAEDFSPAATWAIGPARIDASGQFVIQKLLPLRYSFNVDGIPEDAYIADIRQGTTSLADTGGLRIGDKLPDPLEVVINPKGASITGIVQDSESKNVGFTRVALVPQGSRRRISIFYKSAVTDEDGKFTIRGIAPGDYKLFAWESVPSGAWRDPEFMAPFEELGTPVHVEPAARIESARARLIAKTR